MPALTNSQHERFAQELAKGSSASAAFVAAGYKKHGSNASRLSQNDSIRERVRELQAVGAERAGATVEWVVRGLVAIAERTDEKTADRLSAFDKLGRHLGMFKDKVEVTGDGVFSFKLDRPT